MGFSDFLSGGGSGLITGLAGTIAGSISSSKDRDLQRQLQQQQMEYGREMYALQSKDENERPVEAPTAQKWFLTCVVAQGATFSTVSPLSAPN